MVKLPQIQTLLDNKLPRDWMFVSPYGPAGKMYQTILDDLAVIETFGTHKGEEWYHLSVSRSNRIPSYEDLVKVKRDFIGADRKAIMILPPRSEHVNIHPFCLHLYYRRDGDSLPDFRGELEGVATI